VSIAYLDTHAAVLLYDGLIEKLTSDGKRVVAASELLLPPMAFLELEYMFRLKRIGVNAQAVLQVLMRDFGVSLCQYSFAKVAYEALELTWTQDPFDRLIVAQAIANHNSPLITRDRLIRRHYNKAVW
jgi:PIN domain nuclease of toxin-antitoxin system